MDRELLKGWLESGLSLEQIGALTNRDPSTVGYWCKKHGLSPNGKAKHAACGPLTKDELEPLIADGLTIAQIAEALDRSPSAVRYWLDKLGLRTVGRRGRRPTVPRPVVEQAIAEGKRTLTWRCRRHGEGVFVIENSGRSRCRRCRMERVAAWRRRAKATLVMEAGGRCRLCGYDKHLEALQFHHSDPKKKAFGLSLRGVTRSMRALREEARKCVLLCANCHAEVEAGHKKI
jgi:hypothetical protein